MRDFLIQASGAMAIALAIIHLVLGETRMLSRIRRSSVPNLALLRAIWLNGGLAWIAVGILLIKAPAFGSHDARSWIVAMAVVVLGSAAIGNLWCFKGKHFGGPLLAVAVALAIAGV